MVRNIIINSRAKKAVEVLNSYLPDLDNVTNSTDGNTWKARLLNAFALYLGEDAELSKRLEKLYFTEKETYTVPGLIGIFARPIFKIERKKYFRDVVLSAVQHIRSNGIKRDYIKKNIVSSWSNELLIPTILTVMGAFYFLGKEIAETKTEERFIYVIKGLRDSTNTLIETV